MNIDITIVHVCKWQRHETRVINKYINYLTLFKIEQYIALKINLFLFFLLTLEQKFTSQNQFPELSFSSFMKFFENDRLF